MEILKAYSTWMVTLLPCLKWGRQNTSTIFQKTAWKQSITPTTFLRQWMTAGNSRGRYTKENLDRIWPKVPPWTIWNKGTSRDNNFITNRCRGLDKVAQLLIHLLELKLRSQLKVKFLSEIVSQLMNWRPSFLMKITS
jgi:hypothetical protein